MNVMNVACAIIIQNEKILVTQRSEKMTLPLKWEFPGGKIQSNETEEECIKRELREELSINVRIIRKLKKTFHNYGSFQIDMVPFLVFFQSGPIILSEHKQARWVTREEMISLDWATADIPILEEFLTLEL